MPRLWIALLCAAALASRAGAAEPIKLAEDPPVTAAPKAGSVQGTLSPAAKVASVRLTSRVTGQSYKPDQWDAKTGKFSFDGLAGDATYDLLIQTSDGRQIEGIDLDYVGQRMLRLAVERRKQLGLAPEIRHQFTQDDANEILAYMKDLQDFMDRRRVLYLNGQGRYATVLFEAIRDRDFYARTGDQIIWRVELWYFEFNYGGWEQAAETVRVLRRERIPQGQYKKLAIEWFPQLSVHLSPEGKAKPVSFEIMPPDPKRGRVPTGDDKYEPTPFVTGLRSKDIAEPDANSPG